MGLFKRSRDGPKERRDRSEKMKDFIRGVDVDYIGNSNSGVRVDELRAMQTSAVYACVKILSETVASLPLHLYKKEKEGKHELADQHPLNACLYELPNEEMTSFEFRESMMSSLLLWGNAYARIIRRQGHVVELWYLKPHLMTVERDSLTDKIKYTYSDDVTNETYVYRPRPSIPCQRAVVRRGEGHQPDSPGAGSNRAFTCDRGVRSKVLRKRSQTRRCIGTPGHPQRPRKTPRVMEQGLSGDTEQP